MKLSETMDLDGDWDHLDAVRALERDLDAERIRCMDLAARLDRARTELRAAEAARDEATRDRELVSVLVDAVRARLATAEANYQAVAEALGIMYEGDGRASAPGPVDAVLQRIRWLLALESAEHHRQAEAFDAERRAPVDTRTGALSDEVLLELRNALDWVQGHCHADLEPYYERIIDAFEAAYPDIAKAHAEADGDAVDTRTGEVTRGWAVFLAERDAQRSARGPASVGGWKVGDACEARDVYGTWHAATIADLSTLHGVEEVVECSLANGRKAFVDVGGLRRPAPEATQEWAVGDACEVQVHDTWRPGTVWACPPGGVWVDLNETDERAWFSIRFVRRPIPPTAMEPTIEGGRGLDATIADGSVTGSPGETMTDEDLEDLARRRVTERAEACPLHGYVHVDATCDGPPEPLPWADLGPHAETFVCEDDANATYKSPFFVTHTEMEEVRGLLRDAKTAVDDATVELRDRDTRIADLERRLREAEGHALRVSVEAISEQARATEARDQAHQEGLRIGAWAATRERDEERTRRERAEEKLRRVRERMDDMTMPTADVWRAVRDIIEEESGR